MYGTFPSGAGKNKGGRVYGTFPSGAGKNKGGRVYGTFPSGVGILVRTREEGCMVHFHQGLEY